MVLENEAQLTDSKIALEYNMAIPVRVYGVRKGEETLVDAKQVHEWNLSRKFQRGLVAWAALILAIWAAVITVRRAKRILNEAV
ncbi:hypothetical protein D3C72_2260590 [compost metagenome]